MPRDTVTRLARGEYTTPNPVGDAGITETRRKLWQAVKRVCPEAIKSLRDGVYPAFERAYECRRDLNIAELSLERAAPINPVHEFGEALKSWAESWKCAGEAWLMELAFDTLKFWRDYPQFRQGLMLDLGAGTGWSGISVEEREFRFTTSGWSPTAQHWADFQSKALEAFKDDLEKYRARLSSLMEERGYVRSSKMHKEEHFDWLVLFQFAGKSCHQIANEHQHKTQENLNDSTIQQGVKVAAQLVGLRLRPGTRGPRRKV